MLQFRVNGDPTIVGCGTLYSLFSFVPGDTGRFLVRGNVTAGQAVNIGYYGKSEPLSRIIADAIYCERGVWQAF